MKIRYYLRGLGLGILVTAIFFMVSGKNSQTMSDEMIKARAKELGMSENGVLSELSVEKTVEETAIETIIEEETLADTTETESFVAEEITSEETEEISSEEVVSEEPVTAVEETAGEEGTEETVEEVTSQSVSEPEATEDDAQIAESITSNTEPITVTVNRGEGSDTVSRRLQEAGLVADAYEYDRYLMANGYDKRIGAGEHVIPAGATWEDIAKILCNMK